MKIKKLLCVLLVAVLACTAFASCTAIVEPNNQAQNNAAPNAIATGALTYISLRINPEIEMIADETGTIVSANAVNTDGEVVLSEVELEGKSIEDAAVAFTETAVDLGYMDGKDTVNVDVQSEKAEVAEKVEKSLSDKVMKFFEKKGIAGKVAKEVLDTYLAKAEEWNVSPGHAKIIARALEANPELTYDDLMNLTVKDLLELLKTEKHADKIAADVKDDYKAAVKALKEEYKEMFELREQIDDIEDDLEDAKEADDDDDDDKLTAEEIAALEAELAEKKAALKELEKEYKEKLDALKAEFKVSSKEARDEHKKEADDRKQAKKDGKKYEKPEKDDRDDDDDDDDDRDDKKHTDKKDDDKKGDKEDKGDKNHKNDRDHDDDDDENEEDDD